MLGVTLDTFSLVLVFMSSKFVALAISLHLGQSTNLESVVAKKAVRDWMNRNHKKH
jgi:hypothetical protein